jgi:hypothetical protein
MTQFAEIEDNRIAYLFLAKYMKWLELDRLKL